MELWACQIWPVFCHFPKANISEPKTIFTYIFWSHNMYLQQCKFVKFYYYRTAWKWNSIWFCCSRWNKSILCFPITLTFVRNVSILHAPSEIEYNENSKNWTMCLFSDITVHQSYLNSLLSYSPLLQPMRKHSKQLNSIFWSLSTLSNVRHLLHPPKWWKKGNKIAIYRNIKHEFVWLISFLQVNSCGTSYFAGPLKNAVCICSVHCYSASSRIWNLT